MGGCLLGKIGGKFKDGFQPQNASQEILVYLASTNTCGACDALDIGRLYDGVLGQDKCSACRHFKGHGRVNRQKQ